MFGNLMGSMRHSQDESASKRDLLRLENDRLKAQMEQLRAERASTGALEQSEMEVRQLYRQFESLIGELGDFEKHVSFFDFDK